MVDVTDPRAIAFCNTQLRPLCEQARALVAMISAMNTNWTGGISALFPSDATVNVIDNRTAEGVNELNAFQVIQAVGTLNAIAGGSNAQIIALPCVRPLSAS